MTKEKVNSITITFTAEDKSLYDSILADAKDDRRAASQFLLLYLTRNYDVTETQTSAH